MSGPKATVLCVDDHWKDLIERKTLLEENGFVVLEVTGWEESLKVFVDCTVHAVILDYQLPGMNGDMVAAMMKRLKPHIPIILLSAYGPLPEKKLRPVDAFVYKSDGKRRLLSTLRELLANRSRPFFSRWLNHWKSRNQVVSQ